MDDGPVVLCGLGRVGWRVLDALRAAGLPVAVADRHARPDDPRLAGIHVVVGDIRSADVLAVAGVATARGIVIATSDDLTNVTAALQVRRLNPTARVVVRMFNQSLVPRLGAAVPNTVALSVSALTAPLLVLSALTGEALAAFQVGDVPQQVAELTVAAGDPLAGLTAAEAASRHRLLLLCKTTAAPLRPGDRLVVCGRPDELEPLLAGGDPGGVRWAGRVRRWVRTGRRSLALVDWPVRVGLAVLLGALFGSTLVFRFGFGTGWAEGFYQTVSAIATGADLHGERRDDWQQAFLGGLKLVGAGMLAGVTAVATQYLLRAKLGGVLEAGRIPDGGHVVVCGLGNVGFRCVQELVRLGRPVVAVERAADGPFVATVRGMGVPVLVGDATVTETLRQVRVGTCRAVLAVTSNELVNLEVALLVRGERPGLRVVVRLSDADFAAAVREAADIRYALSLPALAAPAFVAALLGDRVQGLFTAGGVTSGVVELTVDAGDGLCGRTPAAVEADFRVTAVGLAGEPPFAVGGRTERPLVAGDRLTVVAGLTTLPELIGRSARGMHFPAQPLEGRADPNPEPVMSETIDSVKNAAKSAADKAKELAQHGADAVASAAHKAGDALDSLGTKTKNAAEDAADATKDATRDAGKAVERAGQDIKSKGK